MTQHVAPAEVAPVGADALPTGVTVAVDVPARAGADLIECLGGDFATQRAPSALARVTVIVPVGPGDQLEPCLRAQLAQLPRDAQVCVVSCAESASNVARAPPDKAGNDPQWLHLRAATGRASQQNAGAAAARGQWLWFLHADARLAADTLPALARFIAADVEALGYFDLRFLDDGPPLMRLNAAGAWLRSHCLRLPFGDQGLVLPRSVFNALGGFDASVARGEDHHLVWRARHARVPVRPVGASLYTSARRYAARGWGATTREHLGETWRQAVRFSREARRP